MIHEGLGARRERRARRRPAPASVKFSSRRVRHATRYRFSRISFRRLRRRNQRAEGTAYCNMAGTCLLKLYGDCAGVHSHVRMLPIINT
ncbi:hypothetical protein EVAR_37089_1 [Eumeta japonica]|uniref:Uncharacterized protein n=1 Tax=Eumeta variegata TaxID=151549 RepID=A0A4C2A3L2_EUMVA|nr:hypothetical protein EVAR_37089_1 [Eumeta japonica]